MPLVLFRLPFQFVENVLRDIIDAHGMRQTSMPCSSKDSARDAHLLYFSKALHRPGIYHSLRLSGDLDKLAASFVVAKDLVCNSTSHVAPQGRMLQTQPAVEA